MSQQTQNTSCGSQESLRLSRSGSYKNYKIPDSPEEKVELEKQITEDVQLAILYDDHETYSSIIEDTGLLFLEDICNSNSVKCFRVLVDKLNEDNDLDSLKKVSEITSENKQLLCYAFQLPTHKSYSKRECYNIIRS